MSFRHLQVAYNSTDSSDSHRVPKTSIVVAGFREQFQADDRDQTSKHTIADVVWQRHGCVADLGWEEFYEERCDRAINHRHEDDLEQNQHRQHKWVVAEVGE